MLEKKKIFTVVTGEGEDKVAYFKVPNFDKQGCSGVLHFFAADGTEHWANGTWTVDEEK